MAETEKTTFLADSSGSDGSLSKDLSERAEMNFSAPIVALPMDDDISDFQKSPGELKIAEDLRKESPREEKEVCLSWTLSKHDVEDTLLL